MTLPMIDRIAAVKAGAVLTTDDIVAMRQQIWPDGVVSASEVELVFAMNDVIADAPAEWIDFFVEAVSTRPSASIRAISQSALAAST